MTSIHSTSTSLVRAARTPPGMSTGFTQSARRAQQRGAHNLQQRGMQGPLPSGLRQTEAGPGVSALGNHQQALADTEQVDHMTSALNTQANSQKMLSETLNGMISGMLDSANKANTACSEAGKGIKV